MFQAMDELRRIVDGTNRSYIVEVKGRWTEFCTKVQFYSVWKKVLKPPFPLDVRSGKLLFHIYVCPCRALNEPFPIARPMPSTFSRLRSEYKNLNILAPEAHKNMQ